VLKSTIGGRWRNQVYRLGVGAYVLLLKPILSLAVKVLRPGRLRLEMVRLQHGL
jgi:hypothetical protein